MSTKQDFETLTKKLNEKLAQANTKLKTTSENADTGFNTTKTTVEKFIKASEQKLEAEKAVVAAEASLTSTFFKAINWIGSTLSAHENSFEKLNIGLSAKAVHELEYAGSTNTSLATIFDGND